MMRNAVILAAGKGTRMGSLVSEVPKPMLPVNGRPFLDYVLNETGKAGIRRVMIVVGYRKEKIMERYGNWWNGIEIEYAVQEELLGTGHALMQAEGFADRFLVLMGDNMYYSSDISKMGRNTIGAMESNSPQNFGVLVHENGILRGIVEKPKNPPGNLINIGIYGLTSEIFSHLNTGLSERGEIELTDAITSLASEVEIRLVKFSGWHDIGSPEKLEKVRSELKGYRF